MHVVTILYPRGEDTTFDMGYYTSSHMPMFADRIGDNLVTWGASASHGKDYHCIAWAVVKDMGEFGTAMSEHGGEITADVVNYTGSKAVIVTGDITGGSD